jgi:hypothetical protein
MQTGRKCDDVCRQAPCISHHTFDRSASTSFTTDNLAFSLFYGSGKIDGKMGNADRLGAFRVEDPGIGCSSIDCHPHFLFLGTYIDHVYKIVESHKPSLADSAPLHQDGTDYSYFSPV